METDANAAIPVTDARETLTHLFENEFDSRASEVSLALGREQSEIEEIINGNGAIDEDLSMKILALAQVRNKS